MQDTVVCKLCGEKFKFISGNHLKFHHSMNLKQYRDMFPEAETMSETYKREKAELGIRTGLKNTGSKRSAETKKRISEAKRGRPAHNKGKSADLAAIEKAKQTRRQNMESGVTKPSRSGAVLSESTKKKISETLLGRAKSHPRSEETITKAKQTYLTNKALGKHKPIVRQSLSNHHRKLLLEAGNTHRKQMSAAMVERIENICSQNNIRVNNVTTKPLLWHLCCDICEFEYTRSRNAFVQSKLEHQAYRCPACFQRKSFVSGEEQQFAAWLSKAIEPYGMTVQLNTRTVLGGYEIDCYVPEKNIGFEYCGLYWHSESAGRKDRKYHVTKLTYAVNRNVRLVTIFSDEWLNKTAIVKSRILHILGINTEINRIHGRKCVIREIDTTTKNAFLEEYHIQGSDNSKYRLGAFFDDCLVAVMTFTRTNLVKGGDGSTMELNRFAVMQNVHIPGIASKMFSHARDVYNLKEVISYADRRWSNGKVYKQLGFEQCGVTPPSYWYIVEKYHKRVHRSVYMKHKLSNLLDHFDPTLTEWENMRSNNYDRIWDCGCLKYIWKKVNT